MNTAQIILTFSQEFYDFSAAVNKWLTKRTTCRKVVIYQNRFQPSLRVA